MSTREAEKDLAPLRPEGSSGDRVVKVTKWQFSPDYEEQVEKCRTLDRDALRWLVRFYSNRLTAMLGAKFGSTWRRDPDVVREAAQHALSQAVLRFEKEGTRAFVDGELHYWLWVVAKNHLLNQVKRYEYQQRIKSELGAESTPPRSCAGRAQRPDELLFLKQLWEAIDRAVADFSPTDQLIWKLTKEGHYREDIAEMLGWSGATRAKRVRSQLARITKRIAEALRRAGFSVEELRGAAGLTSPGEKEDDDDTPRES